MRKHALKEAEGGCSGHTLSCQHRLTLTTHALELIIAAAASHVPRPPLSGRTNTFFFSSPLPLRVGGTLSLRLSLTQQSPRGIQVTADAAVSWAALWTLGQTAREDLCDICVES